MPNNPDQQGTKAPSIFFIPKGGGPVLTFDEWAAFLRELTLTLNSMMDYANKEIYSNPNLPTQQQKTILNQLPNIINQLQAILNGGGIGGSGVDQHIMRWLGANSAQSSNVTIDTTGNTVPTVDIVQSLGSLSKNWQNVYCHNYLSNTDLNFTPSATGNEYHNDQTGALLFKAFLNATIQYFDVRAFSLFGNPRTNTARVNVETGKPTIVGQTIRATTLVNTQATGGTITTSGLYTIHTFTSNGNFVIPTGGATSFDHVLVGGGSGGATGGGGAGGVLTTTGESISSGTYPVVIGPGSAGAGYNGNPPNPTNGSDSTFNGHTATGGGHGGDVFANGVSGGSGGGGGQDNAVSRTGGSGTGGQGNAGGKNNTGGSFPAGGGGGAGAVGADAPDGTHGGAGGNGVVSIISGNTYGGGGGGGVNNGANTGGAGGSGGGGTGSNGNNSATSGTANTGGGGGGGHNASGTSGAGGSGIFEIRYLTQIPQSADLLDLKNDAGTNIGGFDSSANLFLPDNTSAKIPIADGTKYLAQAISQDSSVSSTGVWTNNGASGDFKIKNAGNGLYIKEGSNATMGKATLSGGTVTVNTSKISGATRIFLTVEGGTLTNVGSPYVSARVALTSFTISSTNALDSSDVGWLLVEPA